MPKNKKIKKTKKEKFVPQALRGMKDILPEEQKYWNFVLEKLEKISKIYGFEKIDLPILEETDLFVRSIGEPTDIVEKEMFTFFDKSGRQISLRPEMTAGIARAYIEHGMSNLPQPLKFYSIGPVFRYEKPQLGRQREFHQFDLEVLGSANSIVDSQILILANNFFKELKLKVEIQINSLGCPECRKEYQKKLLEVTRYKKRMLCPDCQKRLTKNPLRIFDCKEKKCQEFFYTLPSLID
ncbi:MAG: histidine--tRNA ligase, partial [Patescibacteria group bacterium]